MTDHNGLRRSSRLDRIVRDRSVIINSPLGSSNTSIPYLPLEIKGLVAKCLPKSDLKNLRYASKEWHAMATPLLFDKVYISLQDADLQVFASITKHPVLSGCIKDLIYDVSHFPELPIEEYFEMLCYDLQEIATSPSRKIPFKGPHRRLNKLVNALVRGKRSQKSLFSKYSNDEYIQDGFSKWLEAAARERQFRKGRNRSEYVANISSGLRRLSNLQFVRMESDMWDKLDLDILDTDYQKYPNHTPKAPLTRSPLRRSWVPWYLRPERPEDAGFKHLSWMMFMLSVTNRHIKQFQCDTYLHEGLRPMDFAYDITESYPRHMAAAFSQLQSLNLMITPRKHDIENSKALGFLPQLLEQLTGLRDLSLRLITDRCIRKRLRFSKIPLDDTCYNYSQVFPNSGKWPHLESLYLSGLTIDRLDFVFFIFHQLPRLHSLWLDRIDLTGGTWDGIIEALQIRGDLLSWKLVSLQGAFRHEDRQWWPCESDWESEDRLFLDYRVYVENGGRHPSLPADAESSQSVNYFNEIFFSASRDRVKAFEHHVQQVQDL